MTLLSVLPRHAQNLGCLGDCQAERLDAVVPHRKSGVGRVSHCHFSALSFLVAIDQIDIGDVVLLEAEDDPPVGSDGNAPIARKRTFEGVQPETRQIALLRTGRLIEPSQICVQSFLRAPGSARVDHQFRKAASNRGAETIG